MVKLNLCIVFIQIKFWLFIIWFNIVCLLCQKKKKNYSLVILFTIVFLIFFRVKLTFHCTILLITRDFRIWEHGRIEFLSCNSHSDGVKGHLAFWGTPQFGQYCISRERTWCSLFCPSKHCASAAWYFALTTGFMTS